MTSKVNYHVSARTYGKYRLTVRNPDVEGSPRPWVYVATFDNEETADKAGKLIMQDFAKHGTKYDSYTRYMTVIRTIAQTATKNRREKVIVPNTYSSAPVSVSQTKSGKFVASVTSVKVRRKLLQAGEMYFFDEFDTRDAAYANAAKAIKRVCG